MWAVFIVGCIPPTKPFFKIIYQKIATLIGYAKKTRKPTVQESLTEEVPEQLFESTTGNLSSQYTSHAACADRESQFGE